MLKRLIRRYIFGMYHNINGRLMGWHILGFHFDLQVWVFDKEEFADLGWEDSGWMHAYPHQYEEMTKSGRYLEIPAWYKYSLALRYWPLRKPLGYFFLGWLIRSIIAA